MNLRRILRISRWELSRDSGFLERDMLVAVLVSVVVLGGLALTGAVSAPDTNLYTVGVSDSSPYYEPFNQHAPLRVVPADRTAFENGDIDAYVSPDGRIYVSDTSTGHAADAEITSAIRAYNERLMSAESDLSAAFPVRVNVTYVSRDVQRLSLPGVGESAKNELNEGSGQSTSPETAPVSDGITTEFDSESTQTEPESDSDAPSTSVTQDGQAESPPEDLSSSTAGGQANAGSRPSGMLPSDLAPPLPFGSLLIAFALLIPLNFISQVYASSMVNERTNRQGELLLVSPASRTDIVLGKTLPYAVIAFVVLSSIIAVSGGSVLGVIGTIPLIASFLALSFIASSFARSFKELSFFVLGVSVLLMAYAFIPAVFTQVSAVSSISPLSLVVADLKGVQMPLARIAIATIPLLTISGALFVFGTATYREEFLFGQKSLSEKALTTIATQMSRPRHAFFLGALSIPFVFVVELLTLAALLAVPQLLSVPVLLVTIAFIEEVGKSLPIFAAIQSKTIDNTWKVAALAGFLSGFGFFVAEKVTVISQQVGLNSLDLGQVMFQTAQTAPGTTDGAVGLAILLMWPLLHSITTLVSAFGSRYGTRGYVLGLIGATAIHVAYNYTVVILYA